MIFKPNSSINNNYLYNHKKMEKLIKAVERDESMKKDFKKQLLNFVENYYKKHDGGKQFSYNPRDDTYYRNDDHNEGELLNFIWETKEMLEKNLETNCLNAGEKALKFKNKAEELNISWTNPIETTVFSGFLNNTNNPNFDLLFPKVEVSPELATNYELFMKENKKTKHIIKNTERYMQLNKVSTHLCSKEIWIFHISLFLSKNKITIKNFDYFFPPNGESPITSFGYHIISKHEIQEKIDEIEKIENEREISDILLNKILKQNKIEDQNNSKLSLHQYIIILSQYFIEHPRSLKKEYVFHPIENNCTDTNRMNYFTIDYITIQNFMAHIKNVKEKKNDELLETIKTWGKTNSKLKENMKSYDWKELIRSYYTTNNETIPTNIVFYIPEKKITQFCLNHDIIDYEVLIQENIMLDFFVDYSDDDYDDEES